LRLLFVNWAFENHGSAQDLYNYTGVAREMGHEVALYGPPNPKSSFNYSLDVRPDNAVIFIFEFTQHLDYGEKIGFPRLLGTVPRERRVVIDCDGKYNDAISVLGDENHPDAKSSQRWVDICDSLADKICQPTFHPMRSNVRPFLFHAYNPDWEMPLDFGCKEYEMIYVGNNWFRWRAMERTLRAMKRAEIRRIGLIGQGWNSHEAWGGPISSESAYYTDTAQLKELNVEVLPPVPFDKVIQSMGKGVFNPVIYRPLFDHLQLVTCRTFETPAANTIPLFGLDQQYVSEIYGKEATQLVLQDDRPEEKILDLVSQPEHYAGTIKKIRRHLAEQHSYTSRLKELIEIVES
jgi:hypothetical protein